MVAGSIVVGKAAAAGPAPVRGADHRDAAAGGRRGRRPLGLARVEEAILGALVGIAVSMLVAPPLYLQPAGEAIGELAERMARFARGFADGVREPWSRPAADHWMGEARARARRGVARRADRHPGRGGGADEPARAPRPRRPSALPEHADRAGTLPPDTAHAGSRRPGPHVLRARRRAGRGLHAGAARRAWPTCSPPRRRRSRPSHRSRPAATRQRPPGCRSRRCLVELDDRRTRLAGLLAVDPTVDEAAWSQHGSLLAAVDRLRVEIAAAAREVEPTVHSEAPLAKQVRRWVDSMEAATSRLAD